MKVLQVNKHFVPDYGGAASSGFQNIGGVEKVVASFAQGLCERGHDVHVLACQGQRAPRATLSRGRLAATLSASLGTYLSTPLSPGFFADWRRLRGWADVVHAHEPFPLGTLAAGRLPRGVPLVVSWHADIVGKNPALQGVVQALQRRLCARADVILPTSLRMARHSPILAPHLAKCRALPIGIDLQRFLAVPDTGMIAALRERFGGRFALFVGRLVYYKGLDVLISAAVRAPEVRLVIAGEGPLENELRAQVAALGLSERVIVTGKFVPEAELPAWYSASDFLVMPSTHITEGFGIVQIEAMASGRPVINTNLPTGVPEVSLHEVSGLTVEPGAIEPLAAALTVLWRDGVLREQYGNAARARARMEFSEAVMIDRLVGVYEGLRRQGRPTVA
jgi:glycosyltransferase involved in cell wall biosynthesis